MGSKEDSAHIFLQSFRIKFASREHDIYLSISLVMRAKGRVNLSKGSQRLRLEYRLFCCLIGEAV